MTPETPATPAPDGGAPTSRPVWSCPEAIVRPTEVELRVGPFCIETTARRARERLVAALLADEASGPEVERAAELLEAFLTSQDFPALRADDPELAGGPSCSVMLSQDGGGALQWRKTSG